MNGKLAGVSMGFDVEVKAADEAGLELSADGPIGLDVRYDLSPPNPAASCAPSSSVRRGGGITGRLVANATTAPPVRRRSRRRPGRIARAAEASPSLRT